MKNVTAVFVLNYIWSRNKTNWGKIGSVRDG